MSYDFNFEPPVALADIPEVDDRTLFKAWLGDIERQVDKLDDMGTSVACGCAAVIWDTALSMHHRLNEMADQMDGCMKLPVDADGVPIRPGDMLVNIWEHSHIHGKKVRVTAVSEHHIHYQVLPYQGDGHYRTDVLDVFRHCKEVD